MKKTTTAVLGLLAMAGTYVMVSGLVSASNQDMIEVSTGFSMVDDDKIYGTEALENVVGGDSQHIMVKYGISSLELPSKISSSVYVYGKVHDSEKYNEAVAGVGAKVFSGKKLNGLVKFEMDFRAGLGKQFNEGEVFDLTTNASTIGFASGNVEKGNFKGKFSDDTSVFEISIGAGAKWYTPVKGLLINTGYSYTQKSYDFKYDIVGQDNGSQLNGKNQGNHELNIGLEYLF